MVYNHITIRFILWTKEYEVYTETFFIICFSSSLEAAIWRYLRRMARSWFYAFFALLHQVNYIWTMRDSIGIVLKYDHHVWHITGHLSRNIHIPQIQEWFKLTETGWICIEVLFANTLLHLWFSSWPSECWWPVENAPWLWSILCPSGGNTTGDDMIVSRIMVMGIDKQWLTFFGISISLRYWWGKVH